MGVHSFEALQQSEINLKNLRHRVALYKANTSNLIVSPCCLSDFVRMQQHMPIFLLKTSKMSFPNLATPPQVFPSFPWKFRFLPSRFQISCCFSHVTWSLRSLACRLHPHKCWGSFLKARAGPGPQAGVGGDGDAGSVLLRCGLCGREKKTPGFRLQRGFVTCHHKARASEADWLIPFLVTHYMLSFSWMEK